VLGENLAFGENPSAIQDLRIDLKGDLLGVYLVFIPYGQDLSPYPDSPWEEPFSVFSNLPRIKRSSECQRKSETFGSKTASW
jgi:hypothetical protein